jgi:hypothetical protein
MEQATESYQFKLTEAQSELVPVSWVGRDSFPLTDLPAEPEFFQKWGEFMVPVDSTATSLNEVYVDTRIDGWYLLWIGNVVEDLEYKVVAWTPKVNGDSVVKAGYRMFTKVAKTIDQFFTDDNAVEKESNYRTQIYSSARCQQVFSALRNQG